MLHLSFSFSQIFTIVATARLISMVALIVKQFARPEDRSAYTAAKSGCEASGNRDEHRAGSYGGTKRAPMPKASDRGSRRGSSADWYLVRRFVARP